MTTHTVVTRTAIAALLTCVLVAPAASADQEASAIQLDCRCKVFKGFEKENVCHAHLEIANGRLSFGAFSTNGEGTLVVGEFMDKPTYSALFVQPSGAPMAVHAYVPDGLDAVEVTMGDFNPDEWDILFDCR
jgi:hypothetical protein